MDTFRAVMILECGEEGDSMEALSYLIRTGIVWTLQGAYGRMAQSAIESGTISEKGEILENGD